MRFLVFCLLIFLTITTRAESGNVFFPMDRPSAYCLQTIESCSKNNEITIIGDPPSDFRSVPSYAGQPVTLIYDVPELANRDKTAYELLVAPYYRSYCFLFDTNRAKIMCTNRQMTRFELESDAKRL
jgi:hypothetical protein